MDFLSVDKNKKAKESSFIAELRALPLYKWPIIMIVFAVWFAITPYDNIIIATYFASAFFFIETAFCTITESKFNFIVWSTPEQFIINVLFISMLLPTIHYPFQSLPLWTKALLSPIFIWILEICEGYFLIFLFNYNRAWQYFGSDAFFNGTIKLGYAPFWVAMSYGFFYFVPEMIHAMQPLILYTVATDLVA
mmetsp:Transcript_74697/g.67167  ORF Transcript_74697/g.67167 Transcript_74697/m.67167 type:complete len:193 (-) Transcript_74697:41-619(-)